MSGKPIDSDVREFHGKSVILMVDYGPSSSSLGIPARRGSIHTTNPSVATSQGWSRTRPRLRASFGIRTSLACTLRARTSATLNCR